MEIASYQKMLEFYMPWILTQFDLPKGLTIEITDDDGIDKESGRTTLGYYSNEKCRIVLNGGCFNARPVYEILLTLVHELKHAEQYKQKNLEVVNGCQGKKQWKWEKKFDCRWYSFKDADIYTKYHNFPWEVEAREAEDIFWKKWLKRHYDLNIFRIIRWKFFKPKNLKEFTIP